MAISLKGNNTSTYSSNLSAADGTFSGNVTFGPNPNTLNSTSFLSSGGNINIYRATTDSTAVLLNLASDIGGTNKRRAAIFADGKAEFSSEITCSTMPVCKRINHKKDDTSAALGKPVPSDGTHCQIKVSMGNSSGNYTFQYWMYAAGYTGSSRYTCTKLHEQKTETSAPTVSLTVDSSGNVTANMSNGSGFSGFYEIIS